MSPMTPSGFQPNPQVAAMHNKAAAAPPAAPPPDPMAGAQPQTVTLTAQPDGSYSLDDGSGQPVMAASLDEAMQHIQTMMGGDMSDEAPEGDTGEDMGGGGGDGY